MNAITTHAMTQAAPLVDRVADLKQEARNAAKAVKRKPRKLWSCGIVSHEHLTKEAALACIDGVLGKESK
jgi:hypothetical protein